MVYPSNPHRRLPTSELTQRGIAMSPAEQPKVEDGQLPDGAVIIAAITSCTNTSNPRNVVAAGLVAKKPTSWGLFANLGLNHRSRRVLKLPNSILRTLVCFLSWRSSDLGLSRMPVLLVMG